ncbi:MAG TPA: cupredoxin family copper-binding protein [Candidatus Diapherotrites archaeon]|uniref:Cupredoxin family copper-binding protein n=1 Tax=Candidatus Iainarchaeum sp. TaxID=3101447 RepID=A0A7J4KT84_9ARCH|nr:cupredoxin family copper-binding protein [Candidatus Diapherotrites archaeon]HIH32904.1 cupredoxin family copper-binding protein [Candidatus Diapherotrites archaeon]
MSSKILILALVIGAILLAGCTQQYNPPANNAGNNAGGNDSGNADGQAQTVTVEIQNFAYSPAELTIKKGDTVKWVNKDSVQHTATGDSGEFDTGLISQNQEASVTFNNVGTFTYHCTPHPYMKATIIVTE